MADKEHDYIIKISGLHIFRENGYLAYEHAKVGSVVWVHENDYNIPCGHYQLIKKNKNDLYLIEL